MYATWNPNWEKRRRKDSILNELVSFFSGSLEYITHTETSSFLMIKFRDLYPRETFEYDPEDWDNRLAKIYGDYKIKITYPGKWEEHLIIMDIELKDGDMVKKSSGEDSSSDDDDSSD